MRGGTHRWVVGLLLAAVTVAGGILRAEAAATPSRYQSVDEQSYARLARNLARYGRYGDPGMREAVRWPPGAPVAFAVAHKVRPRITHGERWDVPSAYALQAAFGIALIPAVFALAALFAGPAAGLASATAVAFYPPLITASGDLLTEPLGALMLCVALIAVVLALRRESVGMAAVAGALLALTALTRAELVVLTFALPVVAWLALRRTAGGRRAAGVAAAMAGTTALVLAPWVVFASSRTGRFTPVSSGGASNLFVGTYLPGDGTVFGLKRAMGYRPTVRERVILARVARRHPHLDRDAALRIEAMENLERYALGDPVGYAGMLARKAGRLWLGYTRGTHHNVRRPVQAYHLALLLLATAGLAVALALRRDRALWFVAATVLCVTALNVVFVSEARHNLPVMPVLVAAGFAGVALAARREPARRLNAGLSHLP